MQSIQSTVLGTLQRAQRFLDDNAAALGPSITQSATRTTLDQAVTALAAQAVAQTGSKRAALATTAKLKVLRAALRKNHLQPIATIARAQLKQVPEFVALKMPPVNATSSTLVHAATAMHDAASQYQQTFVDAGLAPDFPTQLASATAALNTALTNQGAAKAKQRGATTGIRSEVQRGRQAVQMLDAVIEPTLANNPSLLAEWQTAKRFSGKAQPIAATTTSAGSAGAVGSTTADPAASVTASTSQSTPSAAAPLPSASPTPASTPSSSTSSASPSSTVSSTSTGNAPSSAQPAAPAAPAQS